MPTNPSAALLIIGNEILSGRTRDANLTYIALKLGDLGVFLNEVRVIADVPDVISRHVNELRKSFTYLFTTGGIGPTHDDLTIDSVAAAFGVPVIEDEEAVRVLSSYYGNQLTDARRRMARIPRGASLLYNPISAAPGARIENVFVLPGVPSIMQAMLDSLLPTLVGGPPLVARSIACAAPESLIADDLAAIAAKYPNLTVGSYPTVKGGRYALALVARGTSEEHVMRCADDILSLARKHDPSAVAQDQAS